jgi:hypothetical protein
MDAEDASAAAPVGAAVGNNEGDVGAFEQPYPASTSNPSAGTAIVLSIRVMSVSFAAVSCGHISLLVGDDAQIPLLEVIAERRACVVELAMMQPVRGTCRSAIVAAVSSHGAFRGLRSGDSRCLGEFRIDQPLHLAAVAEADPPQLGLRPARAAAAQICPRNQQDGGEDHESAD